MQVSLIDLLKAKGLRLIDLARKCEVNKATVTRWAQNGVPPTRAVEIEREVGIPRGKLRPDIFGAAQ